MAMMTSHQVFLAMVICLLFSLSFARPGARPGARRPRPTPGTEEEPEDQKEKKEKEVKDKALKFLHKFGYDFGPGTTDEERLTEALLEYQTFHGLRKTGKLDIATKKKMKSPRCGMADIGLITDNEDGTPPGPAPKYKTLVTMTRNPNLKWRGSKVLPYHIVSDHRHISRAKMYYAASIALQAWCSVTSLSFAPVFKPGPTTQPEIDVSFSQGYHNCILGVVFDGPGSILAHAIWPYYYAPYRCDVHMDEAEHWDLGLHYNVEHRTNVVWSMMHEFGHVLGILHTSVNDNSLIMYPHQRLLVPKLGRDDRKAVQSMYGFRDESVPLRHDCGLNLPTEILTDIDAVMEGQLGEHYCFIGSTVYALYEEVTNDYLAFPIGEIQDVFKNGPDSVDAAEYYHTSGTAYLIKDKLVYEYSAQSSMPSLDGRFYQFRGIQNISDTFGYRGATPIDFLMRENLNGIENLIFFKDSKIVWTYPSASSSAISMLRYDYEDISQMLGNDMLTAAFPGKIFNLDGTLQTASYFLTSSGKYVRAIGRSKTTFKAWWKIPDNPTFLK